MLFTHASLRVRPDRAKLYEETFAQLKELVQANEPGCRFFELARDEADPAIYHVLEAYRDADAVEEHVSKDYYFDTADVFVTCIEGDHLDEIKKRGLKGRDMYSAVDGLKFQRFITLD